MATIEQLQRRRRELQAKLDDGDLSAVVALERVDRAISSRTLTVEHSRERLKAAKEAVAAGMDKDKARRIDARDTAKKIAEIRKNKKKGVNRF